MTIKLCDIFIADFDKNHYTKRELLALPLKKDFINEIATRLDLTYLENDMEESNLCFANHSKLRPVFKVFFSKSDVICYLALVLQAEDFDMEKDEVSFPKITNIFLIPK